MTQPGQQPPDWAINVPSTELIHQRPAGLQPDRPFTLEQLLEIGSELIRQFLRRVAEALMGAFVPSHAAFEQIREWAESIQDAVDQIPIIGDIIEIITGVEDGDLNDLGTWVNNLRSFLANLDFSDPAFDPLAAARQFIEIVIRPFLNLLFGWLRPEWLPQISLFSIGDSQPNLLAEPDFAEASTVDGGGFYWDGTDGKATNGCAAVNCDGEDHVIVSNIVPVSKDQKLSIGVYVSHAGVNANNAAALELNTYLDDVPVSTEVIQSLNAFGNSTDWTTKLEGEFIVPDGVNAVAVQLHVTSDATTGVIKFDDSWLRKVQQLKMSFVDGLVAQVNQFISDIQGIIDNIFNAFNNLGEWLDEFNPLQTIMEVVLGLLRIGTGAQTGVTQLEARIRALESAANTITLTFNGASSSNIGPDFTSQFSGGGAGSMGPNGRGALMWKASGFGNRTQIARYTGGALTTDLMVLEWVLASTPQSYLFDDAYTYICARMNGFTDYVRVRSGWNAINIQAIVGGSVSNIGPTWSGYPQAGDHFQWWVGSSSNVREHRLLRNGIEILNFTENVSQYGANHRHIGVGMETGNRLVLFQNIPAGLAVVTASEVL